VSTSQAKKKAWNARSTYDKGTPEQRFWKKVSVQTEGCWGWLAGLDHYGYGVICNFGTRVVKAHRVSWQLHFGSIPVGLFVCHHCDNRACVRPDHLFLGNNDDNMRDMRKKGRDSHGEHHPNSKLTDHKVLEIRARRGTMTQTQLAQEYGVAPSVIARVQTHDIWKHLP
jgi:hypothetical protein